MTDTVYSWRLGSKQEEFVCVFLKCTCMLKGVCIIFNKSVKHLFPSNENLKDDSVFNFYLSDSHSEELRISTSSKTN